jgi:hypothetical protein
VTGALLHPVFVRASVLGLAALIALWAFLSYLDPAFTGERLADVLRCN